MPFTVTMPKLSPTMEEGVIAKWHKKEGDHVEPGDVLLEVSTDKATVEHTALDPGYLRKILVQEGESAGVNEPIAVFSVKKDESIEGYQPEGEAPSAEPKEEEEIEEKEEKAKVSKKERPKEKFAKASFTPYPPLEEYEFEFPRKTTGRRAFASPLAKRVAEETGLDLTSVKGTGPGGRVMSRDLKIAQPQLVFKPPSREIPRLTPGTYKEEKLSPMRKAIGKRLQEAKIFIPHFYTRISVDAEKLVSLREQIISTGLKLTYNDFIIKASASVLRNHPEINSGYHSENESLIRFQTIDISVGVAVEGGLITPIIRHADYKTISEISSEVKYLSGKAKNGKLETYEYLGGSFTISNMGMFDVDDFQAIINPPQAAILAVGKIMDSPMVKDGHVVAGKKLHLVLSADHRVIDGVAAAKFLQDLKKILENPSVLLL